jgi:hypothetical protein
MEEINKTRLLKQLSHYCKTFNAAHTNVPTMEHLQLLINIVKLPFEAFQFKSTSKSNEFLYHLNFLYWALTNAKFDTSHFRATIFERITHHFVHDKDCGRNVCGWLCVPKIGRAHV